MVLPVGTTLYLRPEDVAQDAAEGFYATVTSSTDVEVVYEPVASDGGVVGEAIPVALAVTRVVPDEEPAGSRASTLLRKGVACLHHGDVLFGQVIATSDIAAQVVFGCGQRWVERKDILATASPLLTMLMQGLTMSEDRWTTDFIREAESRLTKCLDDAMSCPAMEEVMDAIDKLSSMTPKGALREWREMSTGRVRPTSTDHALLYTYYVNGGRTVPQYVQPLIGDSIAADPARLESVSSATARSSTKRPRAQSSFLASETSYDAHDDEENETTGFSFVAAVTEASRGGGNQHRANRMRADNAPPSRPATSRMRTTPPVTGTVGGSGPSLPVTTSASAMAALRSRLADDPELIDLLRLATSGDDESVKGRNLFKPTSGVRLVHDMMSGDGYQGMLPHAFLLRLVASAAVQFYPYPAVLMLLYQFAFGPGGLSIMHFTKMTLLDRMALQESNSVNMQDYAASATVPTPRRPQTWSDLQDGVNGLVTYCNMYSDPLTCRVAATLAGFVSALQSYDNWPETHLNVLVYWINERLFAYRGLVEQQATSILGTQPWRCLGSRRATPTWRHYVQRCFASR